MSKIRLKSAKSCIICETESDSLVVLHRSRRQVHSMCEECLGGYLRDKVDIILNNLRRGRREGGREVDLHVRCPGTVHSRRLSNQCVSTFNITTLHVSGSFSLLDQLVQITLVHWDPSFTVCRNRECTNTVYTLTNVGKVECDECKTDWCAYCNECPYHPARDDREERGGRRERLGDEASILNVLERKGELRYCPSCFIPTVKDNGCNKMKCTVCGVKWCWLCLKAGVDYPHFRTGGGGTCANRLWE